MENIMEKFAEMLEVFKKYEEQYDIDSIVDFSIDTEYLQYDIAELLNDYDTEMTEEIKDSYLEVFKKRYEILRYKLNAVIGHIKDSIEKVEQSKLNLQEMVDISEDIHRIWMKYQLVRLGRRSDYFLGEHLLDVETQRFFQQLDRRMITLQNQFNRAEKIFMVRHGVEE